MLFTLTKTGGRILQEPGDGRTEVEKVRSFAGEQICQDKTWSRAEVTREVDTKEGRKLPEIAKQTREKEVWKRRWNSRKEI